MDSDFQMPPVQPMPDQPDAGGQPGMGGQPMPGTQPQQPIVGYTPTGQPMVQQVVAAPPSDGKDVKGLVKTIAIVALSLVAVTFIGLFIWMSVQYNEASSDVNGQIDAAVREAVDEKATQLEMEFAEREKYPFRTFAGPADYGELSFEYPKTWSVYVAKNAATGGDYEAYFNPIEVNVVDEKTLDALEVKILNKRFDVVTAEYQEILDKEDSNLTVESVTIGRDGAITANRYTGTIPDTEFSGYIVVFKIRDKTAVIQTDSTLFEDDYNTLLSTVRFNA